MKQTINKEPDCGDVKCKELVIRGDTYYTRFTKKYENRKNWEKPDERKILSPIPGTIVEVIAKQGEVVKKDEKMLVLEAMKMQNTYYYPMSGKIKNVFVKPGDKVSKGFLMVEFE